MYESREFIRAMGGEIKVTSEPNAGTHVRVEIPVAAS
jgi:signal transduction histidine kinase